MEGLFSPHIWLPSLTASTLVHVRVMWINVYLTCVSAVCDENRSRPRMSRRSHNDSLSCQRDPHRLVETQFTHKKMSVLYFLLYCFPYISSCHTAVGKQTICWQHTLSREWERTRRRNQSNYIQQYLKQICTSAVDNICLKKARHNRHTRLWLIVSRLHHLYVLLNQFVCVSRFAPYGADSL